MVEGRNGGSVSMYNGANYNILFASISKLSEDLSKFLLKSSNEYLLSTYCTLSPIPKT